MRPGPGQSGADQLSAAIEAIVARYAEKIRWIGRDCRLAPDEAEELLQDVRIRLWRVLERGERIAAEKPSYVHRTVMSAAVDLIRRRRDREISTPEIERPHTPPAPGPSPYRAAENADLAERISRALAELSETRRPVLRMYLAGYQIEEIAARLGWTEPKTRNLLYRGLEELRGRLVLLGVGGRDDR
jgi:RNA polymerase sigma-70 factor (ECF subfamily)